MKNKVLIFLFIFSLFSSSAFSRQIKDVNNNDSLSFEISKKEITRISLKNDKIYDIKANKNMLEVSVDKKLGEIYIKPRTDGVINIFITSKKDFVYKLILSPKDIPSEQIILHNKSTYISNKITKNISNKYEKKLTNAMLLAQKDLEILNCMKYSYKKKVKSPVKSIKLTTTTKYSCKDFDLFKIKIKNKKNKEIQESDFVTKNTLSVKFYKDFLLIINSNKNDE